MQNKEVLADIIKSPIVVLTIAAASILWVVLNLMLGLGWLGIVRLQGGRISIRESVSISFNSQFAKYLPGNVFHLAGRVFHGRKAGLSTSMCIVATTLESLVLVVLAGLIGLPFLFSLPQAIPIVLAAIGIGVVLAALFVWMRFDRLNSIVNVVLANAFSAKRFALVVIGSYAAIFLIQTITFIAFSQAFSFNFGWSYFENLQVVSVTWLAGFVVVGSPGGLGVREAAFSLFAENSDIRSSLLIVASSMRVSSMLGDVASLGLGKLMDRMGNRI